MDFIVSLSQNVCLQRKTLLDYTNLFSPNDYEKNDKKKIWQVSSLDFKKPRRNKKLSFR